MVFTIEPSVIGVTPLWHIPWAVIFVVALWVTVTDVVYTRLAIFIDAVLWTYPVTGVCVVVTGTFRSVVLTGASFWCAEEAAHGVIAFLVARSTFR